MKNQNADAGWPGCCVRAQAGAGLVMVVDGVEGGSGGCEGGAREGLCGQHERAESVNGAHTSYYIRTAAGFFFP